MRDATCLILAAGQGKRMHSAIPKVLHEVCGLPMLMYPLRLARSIGIRRIITVVGHSGAQVRRSLNGLCQFVWQRRQLGTADAVLKCAPCLNGFAGNVLILCGDTPLVRENTIRNLYKYHRDSRADATILTALVDKPSGYGRIVRNARGQFATICEEKDATPEQRKISEVNTGAYVFRWPGLRDYVKKVRSQNKQREFYLTDVPQLMQEGGLNIQTFSASSAEEALGINTRAELSEANLIMKQRILEEYSRSGVTIVDPHTTFIEYGAKIGRNTTIYPFSYIEKGVGIGRSCSIGPFCKIRSGSRIRDHAVVGSFVEVVRSDIGKHTLVKHLTYLGDAKVGNCVNIGAGTITANFNGRTKNKTLIGDRAFIGCDTILVAPVKVGRCAKTGAGSVVTRGKNIKPGDIVAGVPARSLKRQGSRGSK